MESLEAQRFTRLTATAFGFVLGGVSNFSSQLIQKGSGVIKANNNVGKVLGKMEQGNCYSSARYAQGDYTRTMNTLSKKVSNRITQSFSQAMSAFGVGSIFDKVISTFI